MKKLVMATGNAGKIREVRQILQGLDVEVLSKKEAGAETEIVEDGDSFTANALIKARAIFEKTGTAVIADDSGIEFDLFGGRPGIYSARFLGEGTSYGVKNAVILDTFRNVPEEKRGAHYRCVIAGIFPVENNDKLVAYEVTTEGRINGRIADKPAGNGGFGYDPIFFLPQFGRTMAELTPDEKNVVSHRGQAVKAMRRHIEEWLKN